MWENTDFDSLEASDFGPKLILLLLLAILLLPFFSHSYLGVLRGRVNETW
jgi:hypothetical protein